MPPRHVVKICGVWRSVASSRRRLVRRCSNRYARHRASSTSYVKSRQVGGSGDDHGDALER
jgi:hypothetical protein